MKESPRFELEDNENENVIFLIQVWGVSNISPQTAELWPRLRTQRLESALCCGLNSAFIQMNMTILPFKTHPIHKDQWNRLGSSDIEQYFCPQISF